jgi:HEAT repeat protein
MRKRLTQFILAGLPIALLITIGVQSLVGRHDRTPGGTARPQQSSSEHDRPTPSAAGNRPVVTNKAAPDAPRMAVARILENVRERRNSALISDIRIVRSYGADSVPALLESLGSAASPGERMLLCTLLSERSNPEVLATFQSLVQTDPEKDVRKHLARILAQHPVPSSNAAVLSSLNTEKDEDVAAELIKSVAYVQNREAKSALLTVLSDGSPRLRHEAAVALFTLNMGEEAKGKLVDLAAGADLGAAKEARVLLGALDPGAAADRISHSFQNGDLGERLEAVSDLRGIIQLKKDASAFALFKSALADPEWAVRREALAGLAESGQADGLPILVNTLASHPDPATRAEAARALAKNPDFPADEVIARLTESLGVEVDAAGRKAIIGVFGLVEGADPRVCSALENVVQNDRDSSTVLLASQTLYQYSGRLPGSDGAGYRNAAVHAVARALAGTLSSADRIRAIGILGSIGGKPESGLLANLADSDPSEELRRAAREAVEQIRKRSNVTQ